MKQKLLELKDFIVEVLLFGFRVFVRCVEAFLDEAQILALALDTLINNEIVKEEAVTKADAEPEVGTGTTPTPPAA